MRALLDTSVLLGPRPEPIQGELAISSVSLAELHFGVLTARSRSERAERLRRLAVIEAQLSPLPVDQQLAVPTEGLPPPWWPVADSPEVERWTC